MAAIPSFERDRCGRERSGRPSRHSAFQQRSLRPQR